MKTVFDKPLILNAKKDHVVLIYSDYIVADVTRVAADLAIEKIDNGRFNSLDFDLVLEIKSLVEYEFKPGNDFYIKFTISKDGVRSHKTIYFDNIRLAAEAEKSIEDKFKELGFKREEVRLTPLEVAITPGKAIFASAGFGALITWYAYDIQFNNHQTHQRRIKWYVALFQQLAKSVGYMPFLIITIVLVGICLIWLIKKMISPSSKIIARK